MAQNIWLIAVFGIFGLCGCKKETTAVPPELSLTGISVNEGFDVTIKAAVKVHLSKSVDNDVTFNYTVTDGTAKKGSDFNATNGTLVIKAGQLSADIDLDILPDDIFEFNETFTVAVENVQNATVQYNKAVVTILDNDSYTPASDANGVITPNTYPGMTLVWSDEFNDAQLNTNFWTYEKGATGWGNNELQNYTDASDNVFIQNGILNIKAIKTGSGYTSGRIITKGKKEFKYGRIDIRAKLPAGKGIWPALWMLGANISTVSWPACGEIDIMEYLGHEVSKVYGTAHYDQGGHKYQGGNTSLSTGGFNDKFHVFTILWQEGSITWYVDYQQYYKFSRVGEPFNKEHFFILNVAVGGNWPGNPDASTVFPQTMQVDYLRIFQ